MIRRLTGEIVSRTELAVVIEVNGVGYLVYSPAATTIAVGEKITFHTYLAVRETALDLYGFKLEDELVLFERLLSLPKIGPKSALQILAQSSLELINEAVSQNDAAQLSKMSGIGKKTAEKVVAGLIDIYEKEGIEVEYGRAATTTNGQQGLSDTIDALVSLGYGESVARKTVQEVKESQPELSNTNDILKAALKLLS